MPKTADMISAAPPPPYPPPHAGEGREGACRVTCWTDLTAAMDDRTATDFTTTQPLDTPVARKRVKSNTGRRLGLLLLLVGAAAAGWWVYGGQAAPPPARQNALTAATPVVAAPAVTRDIDITLNGLGTVTSLATVTVKSQISGQLIRVAYP